MDRRGPPDERGRPDDRSIETKVILLLLSFAAALYAFAWIAAGPPGG